MLTVELYLDLYTGKKLKQFLQFGTGPYLTLET